jgi:hypothetical protein
MKTISKNSFLAYQGDALIECVKLCNNSIQEDTENPFDIILQSFYLYKAILNVEQNIYGLNMSLAGKQPSLKLKPVEFEEYFRMLDYKVIRCLRENQFPEYYFVIQNIRP